MCSVVSIPLVTRYLGQTQYAVYGLVAGIIPWLALLEIGLGGTIQNYVSEMLRSPDEAIAILAYARRVLVVVGGLAMIAVFVGSPLLYHAFFAPLVVQNAKLSISTLALVLPITVANVFVGVAQRILIGRHDGHVVYIYQALNSVATVGLLLGLVRYGETLPRLPAALAALVGLPVLANLALWHRSFRNVPNRVDLSPSHQKEFWRRATRFALLGLLAAGVNQVDVLIAPRVLPIDAFAKYALLQRIFQMGLAFAAAVLMSVWPMISQYSAEGEHAKARALVVKLVKASIGIGVALLALVPWLLPPLLATLAPTLRYPLTPVTCVLLALLSGLRLVCDVLSTYFMATNRMRLLLVYVPAQILLAVCGIWLLGTRFGIPGVFGGLVLSYLLTAAWLLPLGFWREREVVA